MPDLLSMSWPSIVLAVCPALVWLWIFHRKDDHEPEPPGALIGAFLFGGVAVGLVLLARPALEVLLPTVITTWRGASIEAFFVTAPLEEGAKYLVLLVAVMVWRKLDEPLDAVIYGIAVGLGFASAENLVFAAGGTSHAVLLQRGVTSTLGHVVFTGSLGYFLGHAWFSHGVARVAWTAAGLASAIVLHGLYDLLLISPGRTGTLALLVVLPVGLALLGWKIRHLRGKSGQYHPG